MLLKLQQSEILLPIEIIRDVLSPQSRLSVGSYLLVKTQPKLVLINFKKF